jgi:hypothetical protein
MKNELIKEQQVELISKIRDLYTELKTAFTNPKEKFSEFLIDNIKALRTLLNTISPRTVKESKEPEKNELIKEMWMPVPFENTCAALNQCLYKVKLDELRDLPESERFYFKKLINLCGEFIAETEEIDPDNLGMHDNEFDDDVEVTNPPKGSFHDVKMPGETRRTFVPESVKQRGVRDGTGPYKGSAQRKMVGKGRRRMAGKRCPIKESTQIDFIEQCAQAINEMLEIQK